MNRGQNDYFFYFPHKVIFFCLNMVKNTTNTPFLPKKVILETPKMGVYPKFWHDLPNFRSEFGRKCRDEPGPPRPLSHTTVNWSKADGAPLFSLYPNSQFSWTAHPNCTNYTFSCSAQRAYHFYKLFSGLLAFFPVVLCKIDPGIEWGPGALRKFFWSLAQRLHVVGSPRFFFIIHLSPPRPSRINIVWGVWGSPRDVACRDRLRDRRIYYVRDDVVRKTGRPPWVSLSI
jgi:hypothetical protein